MIERPPLRVVLCWHMHQPQYRDPVTGEYLLPWTYLHAIKDYVDMAVHLEAQPAAAAVVNFTPVLIEQIEDYSAQVNGWLRRGTPLRDPVLGLLTPQGMPSERAGRIAAVKACLKANRQRLIERFEPYKELAGLAESFLEGREAEVSAQFITDLAVWYHLAWLGETVRTGDPRVAELMAQAHDFSTAHCRQLLEIIGEILAGILPRYRRLLGNGQVELSVTPWGHPIVPLMLDFNSAREAWPQVSLPAATEYPGGDDRARWHVARAVQAFTRAFGVRPQGCWPAEGGVSTATLALLEEFGFQWAATGEAVLRNSLTAVAGAVVARDMHRPYCLSGGLSNGGLRCFFRDDGLSDRIGFTYATWHGDDAAANLVHELETLERDLVAGEERVVSIVLDGENAWEYYPFNAFYFLQAMYQRLSGHPRLKLTTFSQCLAEGVAAREIGRITAGSWVYGTFSTWIGHPAKNRAWEMLCEAKQVFDRVVVEGMLSEEEEEAAERQLGVCEGSDWFWWFGDDNPAEAVASFDGLFRRHLTNLYRLLGEEPPKYLTEALAHGGGAPEAGGTMKRSQ